MNNLEKINIYVPEHIGHILENDAFMFEILKKDGYTINKNKFLSLLILGYFDFYNTEYQKLSDALLQELDIECLDQEQKICIADNILKNVILPSVPLRKGKNPIRLSLKPTKETQELILYIMNNLKGTDFISQYFCRLFMSYCEKPFCIREQILFKDTYNFLQEACKNNRPIHFTTKWNPSKLHEVIPYKMAIGKEELFNYLVCAEYNEETGKQEAQCYRLNRINTVNYSGRLSTFLKETVTHMEKMIKFGPQFSINDDDETCVKLTEEGIISYNRIYYGRPKIDHIEKKNDATFYYFNCSKTQLFLYFKKFNPGEAEVIYPFSLREKLIHFHKTTLDMYLGNES